MSAATPPPVLDPWHKDFSPSSTPVLHDERSEDKLSPTEEAAELLPVLDPGLQSEILKEFDPLADQALKDANEAWQGSEGHPPPPPSPSPPRTSSPPPPPPPIKDPLPAPTPSSSSSFSSLAAFARTFSIPSLPRSRPLSLDAAKPVPSPNTLSSFAAQQSEPSQPLELKGAPHSGRNSPAGSGTASPHPDSQDDKAKDPQFDFQKFLDQMKLKAAEPVAKYLRSFLSNFAKRTFTVHDQVKIIHDFLDFISGRMRDTDIWRNATDAEFDNAMEGMEKLVMNRLYDFTFTPQVAHAIPPRPITSDDLERDRVLSQRIALFGWLQEEHLDVPEGEGSKGFMMFAQQELLKINHYKAPRDKLICILNCCKVIFGLIRHLHTEEGADSFVPILIFVVLKANPEHLLSNVEFINRFRNPTKLQSEAGYYLSSLMGAVSFIETMDHTSVSNISQEEFERNVESAIQSLPSIDPHSPRLSLSSTFASPVTTTPRSSSLPKHRTSASASPSSAHAGEESASPLSLPAPPTITEDARRLLQKTGDTISKPLNAIGRILSDALEGGAADGKLSYLPGPFAPFELGRESRALEASAAAGSEREKAQAFWPQAEQSTSDNAILGPPQTPAEAGGPSAYTTPMQTPYKQRVRRVPSPQQGSPGWPPEDTPTRVVRPSSASGGYPGLPAQPPHPRLQFVSSGAPGGGAYTSISRTPTPALDFAAVQAQIDSAQEEEEQEREAKVETLVQMFPAVEKEVVGWVLEANEGDLGSAIEALLDMGAGG